MKREFMQICFILFYFRFKIIFNLWFISHTQADETSLGPQGDKYSLSLLNH